MTGNTHSFDIPQDGLKTFHVYGRNHLGSRPTTENIESALIMVKDGELRPPSRLSGILQVIAVCRCHDQHFVPEATLRVRRDAESELIQLDSTISYIFPGLEGESS